MDRIDPEKLFKTGTTLQYTADGYAVDGYVDVVHDDDDDDDGCDDDDDCCTDDDDCCDDDDDDDDDTDDDNVNSYLFTCYSSTLFYQ